MQRPILYQYFDKKASTLLSNYDLSSEQKASINLGNNREIFINEFLGSSLPPKLSVQTGEIWDKSGFKTGQLDTIIVRDDAPSLDFGKINAYLAEGVFAVIEVKSNLTINKLKEAYKTLKQVHQLQIPAPTITMGGNNLKRPLRILFAYKGAQWDTLGRELDKNNIGETFDLICILSRGVWVRRGRLMFAYQKDTGKRIPKDFIIETNAAALGFMYYYLVQYGTSFSTGSIQLEEYFKPLEKWGKDV